MPELPDVEIARRRLESVLVGATVTAAHSTDRRVLRPQSTTALTLALVGRTVRSVDRRGKWLRVLLDDGGRMFSHLGMTGRWVERALDGPEHRAERARIDVVRDAQPRSLRYLDSRRFGRLIVAGGDIAEWRALGPDPLADGIDEGGLAAALSGSRRAVKAALMDQSVLAGIGNILATEALWRARVDPRSPSDALSRADVARLARALVAELGRELAVRESRESPDDNARRDVFSVYGHAGAPCPRCPHAHRAGGHRGTNDGVLQALPGSPQASPGPLTGAVPAPSRRRWLELTIPLARRVSPPHNRLRYATSSSARALRPGARTRRVRSGIRRRSQAACLP